MPSNKTKLCLSVIFVVFVLCGCENDESLHPVVHTDISVLNPENDATNQSLNIMKKEDETDFVPCEEGFNTGTSGAPEIDSYGPEVVKTRYGLLEGVKENGVIVFKGIPYARPPVGDLRFHSPEEPEAWEGIKRADIFGPICAQYPLLNFMADILLADYEKECEDCLYLNVWTPSLEKKKRPVMVWIHGGGAMYGSGSQSLYTGELLCEKGEVIVVTFNYRLGVLGNLTHPDLIDEKGFFGNWGILDMVAALRWVRENIEAFGGDPENVTIFGESAGGWSVCSLMISPETWNITNNKRLFQKSISESPAIKLRSLMEAVEDAEKFYKRVGCPDGDISCLRNLSFNKIRFMDEMLMEVIPPIIKPLLFDNPELRRFLDWNVLPAIDGVVIPKTPADAMVAGWTSDLQMIIGTCQEEADVLGYIMGFFLPRYLILNYIEAMVPGEQTDGIKKSEVMYDAYFNALKEAGVYWPGMKVFGNILTDYIFRIPAIKFAEMHKQYGGDTYMYQMAYPFFFDQSIHVTEVPFVFGHLKMPGLAGYLVDFNRYPLAVRLKDAIQDAWINFAYTGVPDINTEDVVLSWPQYEASDRRTMIFSKDSSVAGAPEEVERAVWDEVGAKFFGF